MTAVGVQDQLEGATRGIRLKILGRHGNGELPVQGLGDADQHRIRMPVVVLVLKPVNEGLATNTPGGSDLTGFIMVEQVKSIDFRSRAARRIGRASEELLAEVLSILDACVY